MRAAEILRPQFAAQEQENRTRGLQLPQLLFYLIVIVVDERFTSVISARINTVQTYQGLVSKCLPR